MVAAFTTFAGRSFHFDVDKVPHQRLILKLESHGMGNSIINWIEQWLTDRRQRVVVDAEVSSLEISLEWGAPRICTRTYFIFGIHIVVYSPLPRLPT